MKKFYLIISTKKLVLINLRIAYNTVYKKSPTDEPIEYHKNQQRSKTNQSHGKKLGNSNNF